MENCGETVITNYILTLVASCEPRCPKPVRYEWKVFEKVASIWTEMTNMSTQTSDSGRDLFLLEQHTLTPGREYMVQATATSPLNPQNRGLAQYSLWSNNPPFGGRCTSDPQNGIVLETKFHFMFSNWLDLDQPIMYGFYFTTVDGFKALLHYGPEPHLLALLPVGQRELNYSVSVQVHVADVLGQEVVSHLSVQVIC